MTGCVLSAAGYYTCPSVWETASPGGKVLLALMFLVPALVVVAHDLPHHIRRWRKK